MLQDEVIACVAWVAMPQALGRRREDSIGEGVTEGLAKILAELSYHIEVEIAPSITESALTVLLAPLPTACQAMLAHCARGQATRCGALIHWGDPLYQIHKNEGTSGGVI